MSVNGASSKAYVFLLSCFGVCRFFPGENRVLDGLFIVASNGERQLFLSIKVASVRPWESSCTFTRSCSPPRWQVLYTNVTAALARGGLSHTTLFLPVLRNRSCFLFCRMSGQQRLLIQYMRKYNKIPSVQKGGGQGSSISALFANSVKATPLVHFS